MLLVICQLGRDVISYERVHKEVLFELHWTQYMDWVWLSSITISLIDKGKYWKVPMVATLVTFGARIFRGVVTLRVSLFSGTKNHKTRLVLALFRHEKYTTNIYKKKHFICVTTYWVHMSSFTFCPPHWWLWIFKYQYCLVTCWNELYYLVVRYKFDYGLQ